MTREEEGDVTFLVSFFFLLVSTGPGIFSRPSKASAYALRARRLRDGVSALHIRYIYALQARRLLVGAVEGGGGGER